MGGSWLCRCKADEKRKEVKTVATMAVKIKVDVYPSVVYLDGVKSTHEELQGLYNEMYHTLDAKFFLGFI